MSEAGQLGLLIWGMLLLRPYVFVFLCCYLWSASRHLGWRRTLTYLVSGYVIAWASEFSSIQTGFPYGYYIYIPATRQQELWVAGVPFMDSLSYVFLTYASYCLALLLQAGWRAGRRVAGPSAGGPAWATILLGAVLFVTLDVVIDPLSLRGYRWFLGQIYGYPEYGLYFGIPLSNFAGWLVVGLVMITVLQRLARRSPGPAGLEHLPPAAASAPYPGTVLYFGVLLFNLVMTFVIGEILLGFIATGIFLILIGLAGAAWLQLKEQSRLRPEVKAGPTPVSDKVPRAGEIL